jgi:acetyltransferase-like isoleucine patch superfamily enzyme
MRPRRITGKGAPMGMLRAIADDLRRSGGSYYWLEAVLRRAPGHVGIELRRLFLTPYFGSAGNGLMLYPGTRIFGPSQLSFGDRCRVGFDCFIQANGGVELGDDVLLGPGVRIWSVNHVFARLDLPISEQGYEHKQVVIGSGVWIGADCFIMPGANIGDGAVISAGSVVSGKTVEPGAILAGNPARKVGSRFERADASATSPP